MFKVDKEKCVGCGVCVNVCPAGAISMDGDKAVINNQCVDCGQCVQVCPQGAIQSGDESPRNFNQGQMFPGSDFGMGGGRGMGRGLGRGPRDGRGGGKGGGGRR